MYVAPPLKLHLINLLRACLRRFGACCFGSLQAFMSEQREDVTPEECKQRYEAYKEDYMQRLTQSFIDVHHKEVCLGEVTRDEYGLFPCFFLVLSILFSFHSLFFCCLSSRYFTSFSRLFPARCFVNSAGQVCSFTFSPSRFLLLIIFSFHCIWSTLSFICSLFLSPCSSLRWFLELMG